MARTQKSQTCDKGRCKRHAYILKPLQKNFYFSKAQRAKFCPKYNKNTRKFQNSLPTFNIDSKQYTPLFILEDQRSYYSHNDEKFRVNHQKRVKQCVSKDSLITQYVPRHARKRQFCSVCRANYQEYIDHIEQQEHKLMLRQNKYTEYIEDLEKIIKKYITEPKIPQQVQQSSTQIQKYLLDRNKHV